MCVPASTVHAIFLKLDHKYPADIILLLYYVQNTLYLKVVRTYMYMYIYMYADITAMREEVQKHHMRPL